MDCMKPRGKHPEKALTPMRVRAVSEPGRYADGNGLHLVVDRSGAKRWILRTVIRGRRCDLGLGSVALVSLVEAREQAAALRKVARAGGDPLEECRKARTVVPTFEQAAHRVHKERADSWKNEKHRAQWITTLETYAFPELGKRRVDHIGTPDVLRVLSPIWLTKPETARRLRQRIRVVLDWAKAAGFRSGENPVEGVKDGLPKQTGLPKHHQALPYDDVRSFVAELRVSDSGLIVKLAFEFLILTAARSGEVRGATWSEIDLKRRVWTIPAARMKATREHRVPLSDRCIEILSEAKQLKNGGDLVFAGASKGKRLSDMVFTMHLRRMNVAATAHGFRSSFRDWAAETTSFPADVCEIALAHTIRNKVEAAYRRGDLFDKRRRLVEAWADFVVPTSTDVIHITSRPKPTRASQ